MIKTKSDPPTLIISTQNICLKKDRLESDIIRI